jgi:hypothetical protein
LNRTRWSWKIEKESAETKVLSIEQSTVYTL